MVFEFGPFALDLASCELRRDGERVRLQPRVFRLLQYLIEHRDRVVSRQELIEALWGGQQLNAVAVPWAVHRLRNALAETNEHFYIETVRSHGYRFVGALRANTTESQARSDSSGEQDSQHGFSAPPFVGRAAVMQELTRALEAAAEGRGRLFLLTGEAGIGKTRCADELALVARHRGAQVWTGRCVEQGNAPAFWPFIQILRSASADASTFESELAELLGELEPDSSQKSPQALVQSVGDCGERFWLLDRLSRWLVSSTRSFVRVIFIDDLHCADESSLAVLSLLAPLLARSRLLVLATARDDCPSGDRSLPALSSRLRPFERLPLHRLRDEDVETWLCAVLGEPLASQLAPRFRRAEGNPLFLHELARTALAHHARHGSMSGWESQLPAAVREVISARLQALEPATRSLLDAACVIGDQFSAHVLQQVTRLDMSALLTGLHAAVRADIVSLSPEHSKHSFAHPLVREVLYDALSWAERTSLHGAVGAALEKLGPVAGFTEIAYHFHHAPLAAYFGRAALYGRRAGDASMRARAYDEAVQCYAWALEAQGHADPPDVPALCDVLLLSAAANLLAGRPVQARQHCQRAIDLAVEAGLPEVLVSAARQLRPSVWIAALPNPLALRALEHALRILPADAHELRAKACAQLAALPPYSLRREQTQRLSAEALRLAAAAPSSDLALYEALHSRLYGLCGPQDIAESLRVADEILAQKPAPNQRWAADAQFARYQALLQRGDGPSVERELAAYTAQAIRSGQRFLRWQCERLRAQQLLHAGHVDAAQRRFEELFAEAQLMNLQLGHLHIKCQRDALSCERIGRRQVERLRPAKQADSLALARPELRVQRVLASIDCGLRDVALGELRKLAEYDFAAVTADPFGVGLLVELAQAAVTLSDRPVAITLRELLVPHAHLVAITPMTFSLGGIARYLGALERCLDCDDQARRYFEQAIEVDTRAGHQLERQRATLGLAEVLGRSARASDRTHAFELAGQVRDEAVAMGALANAARARSLATKSAAASARAPAPAIPRVRQGRSRRGSR